MEPIIVEQVYRAPIDRVWRAITDPSEMPKWFFSSIETFEPRPGFETRFNVRSGDRDYLHLWKVTEAIAQEKLVYDWKYGGTPGESFVTWELAEAGEGTRLRLTHTFIESFPQDDPAFHRESGVAGWRYFIGESLKAFLTK